MPWNSAVGELTGSALGGRWSGDKIRLPVCRSGLWMGWRQRDKTRRHFREGWLLAWEGNTAFIGGAELRGHVLDAGG